MEITFLRAIFTRNLVYKINNAISCSLWTIFIDKDSAAKIIKLFKLCEISWWAVAQVPINLRETLWNSKHFCDPWKQFFINQYSFSL